MSEVHDIRKFKALKHIKKDLELLKPKIDDFIRELENYKHYIPISNILLTMKEESVNIKIHTEKVKKEISVKGKI